jgi:ubiquinone/menaquinone biosynthesis C-methylase UbiE
MKADYLCDVLTDELRGASKVLDLGCGSGQFSSCIAGKIKSSVIGLDVSKHAITRANKRLKHEGLDAGAFCQVGEAEYASGQLRDHRFDAVMIVYALHHFADPRQALREAWRLLKRDGKLVIADYALPEGRKPYGCHTMRVSDVWEMLESKQFRGASARLLEPGFALYTARMRWRA